MSKKEFYQQLPSLLRRLFTWGLLAAVVFLLLWYNGGINVYSYFLAPLANLLIPIAQISYEPGSISAAQFIYQIQVEGVGARELTFSANQLNSSFLEVVTLLAMWPKKSWLDFLKLCGWCLLFLIFYHSFQIFIQCYNYQIGPELANSLNLFWEPSGWKSIIRNISKFDLFILRFWAGFPVFGFGLVAHHLLSPKLFPSVKEKQPKKAKAK